MKKLLVIATLLLVLLIGAWAAGPFMAVRGIRQAVATQDTAALAGHVDFPMLRGNLKAQVEDAMVRRAGIDAQSGLLGAIALRVAGGVSDTMVDAMVTPAGIGALLEGRGLWHRAIGGGMREDDAYTHAPPEDLLADAKYRFESTSRFTATVPRRDGAPVVFVLTRDGFRWRLSDIRLPISADTEADRLQTPD